jgi:type IV pilus assembly protein PilV
MNRLSTFKPVIINRSSGINGISFETQNGSRQAGFTLLEALVTLVILAVGLMGLAFLQAQGMQLNTSAYSRTQASILASDMIDRIRLNSVNSAAYDTGSFSPNPSSCTVTGAPDADNDRHCWYGRLEQALPGGDGDINVDGATGFVTVTIRWEERPAGRREDDFDPSTLSQAELDELRIQQMSMSVAI